MNGDRDGQISKLIHRAWTRINEPGSAERLARECQVPGRLSLRQRFELVLAGPPNGFGAEAFAIPDELWDQQVAWFDEGDAALKANNPDGAAHAFAQLKASHRDGDYPAALVEANIGLGDSARQADRIDEAIAYYAEAVGLASRCDYVHARVRASIPLAYLHMRLGSSEDASLEFGAAYRMARERGWRLDMANALTGLGEALQRLQDWDKAISTVKEAFGLFEDLKSSEGMANAATQLGEVYRRGRNVKEAAVWYGKAVDAAKHAGMIIALANALDGLAEVELAAGDVDAARAHHRQSYDLSGTAYPRGQAHALNGLARCDLAVVERGQAAAPNGLASELESAAELFAKALAGYLDIGDLTSAAASRTGLARCAELANNRESAVRFRLEAVAGIEKMRSGQGAHRHQDEYFRRFDSYYVSAMRTAIRADDLVALVTVFEAVAGRRLANLAGTGDLQASDAKALNTAMVDLSIKGWRVAVTGEGTDDHRRRVQSLGKLALRNVVTQAATEAFDDVMAAIYQPFDQERAPELLEDLSLEPQTTLAIAILPTSNDLAWLWIDRETPVHAGIHELRPETAAEVKRLRGEGLRHSDRRADIALLEDLLPRELTDLLPRERRITIVPAGLAWGLPWPAIPTPDGGFLGERCPLALCPSLTVLRHLVTTAGTYTPPATVAAWRAANVSHHDLRAFDGEPPSRVAKLSDAPEARLCLINHLMDMVAVISHGRPLQELVHYLELDQDTFVTPSDILAGRTPRMLALIACWGANAPLAGFGDPLTIATLALVRGSVSVAATASELLDDTASSQFTAMFLAAALRLPFPEALHHATVRWLRVQGHRDGPLSRWAPLAAMGM
ncbi:MAG: tetratricopeptide repeat protein [Bifidobacteriaceae bacterium]|jgi:tetratricopeptide (TPR) repeat protein|nr:tetratricopeptide repeat protein [Bifidobacteriaceae bacterium]